MLDNIQGLFSTYYVGLQVRKKTCRQKLENSETGLAECPGLGSVLAKNFDFCPVPDLF